jgi:hypothetical protein
VITVSRRPVREGALSAAATGTDTPKPVDPPSEDEATPASHPRPLTRSGRRSTGRHPFTPADQVLTPEPVTVIGTTGPIGPLRGMVNVSGRLVLGAPRVRGLPSIDVVEFVAACPACGRDVTWIEEREETRLRIIIECPCSR